MKVKEFTYTKANGEVSTRTIVELVAPSEHVEGIDVSGLSADDFAAFTSELNELERAISAQRSQLYAKYDLGHNYRRFLPNRMSNVSTEYI